MEAGKDRWKEVIEEVVSHFEKIKNKVEDEEMKEALGIYEKVLTTDDFSFTWDPQGGNLVVEGAIELETTDPDFVPSFDGVRGYLILVYPGPIFQLLVKRLMKLLQESKDRYVEAPDVLLLGQTLANLDTLGTGQFPSGITTEGKGSKILVHLPLTIEIESEKFPTDAHGWAMLIAENMQKIIDGFKEKLKRP